MNPDLNTRNDRSTHWSLINRTSAALDVRRIPLDLGRSQAGLGRLTVRDASRVLGLSCGSQH